MPLKQVPRHKRLLDRAMVRLAALCWLAAAISYLASEALAASAFSPSYSYAENYVSDLGVLVCGSLFDGRPICSPLHWLVNADFVLQGVLFVLAALAMTRALASPARHALAACAVLNGVGICLVGLFPETASQLHVHGLGAGAAIVFGNATALVSSFAFGELCLPPAHRVASFVLPALAAVALVMLMVARDRAAAILVPDGVWERLSVYTITAWELITAGCLAIRARRRGCTT